MSIVPLRWHAYRDGASLVAAVIERVAEAASLSIAERGRFLIVLAGGTTPRAIYTRLSGLETDWTGWHVYFGDERCLPAGHPERNETMARETWLDDVPIPPAQVHAVPAGVDPREAARRYAGTLAGIGRFDLVLLGLGEDGHTASLFPGHVRGIATDAPDVLPVTDAPSAPSCRVTLSAARLSRSRAVLVVATGEAKREALRALRQGTALPIAAVRPPGGVDVYTDRTDL